MKNFRLVALIATLTLVGCNSPQSKSTPLPGEDGITAADVSDAALAPGAEKLVEPLHAKSAGDGVKYATGEVWARVFTGQDLATSSVEPLSTRLSERVDADGTRHITYDVDVRLSIDDKPFPLHATATRTSTASGESAMRQAVAAAVIDVAKQAKVIEKRAHPSFLPE